MNVGAGGGSMVGEATQARKVPAQANRRRPTPLRLPLLLRLMLGLGVLAYLVWRTEMDLLRATFLGVNASWLLMAVAVQLVGKLVWSLRWASLLKVYAQEARLLTLMKAIYIGQFFNNFLPTSIGGDLARGYWILDNRDGYERSMFIILLERFIGLVTMGFVALPALLWLILRSGGFPEGDLVLLVIVLLVLCGGILALQPSVFRRTDALVRIVSNAWLREHKDAIQRGLERLQASGFLRVRVYVFSVLVQFIGIGFYYALGRAIGLELVGWHYLVIVPLVTIATMLPITINGLGVREGSLILLTTSLGANVRVDQALALGLLASVLIALISLLGGLFYIQGREAEVRDA